MTAMRNLLLGALLLASGSTLLTASCAPEKARVVPAGVRMDPYATVEIALYLEAPGPKVTAVALPDVAGRIVHYSLAGENILWDKPDAAGRPQAGGGYGLDLGPENLPRHPAIWEARHQWGKLGSNIVAISSDPDPALGMTVQKQIMIDAATGALEILQRMKNVSDKNRAYFMWDRTLCKAGGFTLIPINPKSRFPAKWVLGKRLSPVTWEYNGTDPYHPAIKVIDGVLVSRSQGKEQKFGADSDAGWIAYTRGKLLFVKYYPYFPEGKYADAGMSVAHYFNERLAELEPMSPEIELKPKEEYVFPERWLLIPLDREVTSHEEAVALKSRIPPSPFGKK